MWGVGWFVVVWGGLGLSTEIRGIEGKVEGEVGEGKWEDSVI
jgi:hypothetical protein